MSERAKRLMEEIWHERNTWANTEEKLVAATIRKAIGYVENMTTTNNLTVLDKNDILTLSKELESM